MRLICSLLAGVPPPGYKTTVCTVNRYKSRSCSGLSLLRALCLCLNPAAGTAPTRQQKSVLAPSDRRNLEQAAQVGVAQCLIGSWHSSWATVLEIQQELLEQCTTHQHAAQRRLLPCSRWVGGRRPSSGVSSTVCWHPGTSWAQHGSGHFIGMLVMCCHQHGWQNRVLLLASECTM